jgi:large subunit ribosomal protein L19e|tara:strand:- start:1556 stop:2005 length:450 start_codon:yes stop_codon:yes gene_type:complete
MELKLQKRLAAQILKCSPKRVSFDTESLQDIKEAITKIDISSLINDNVIKRKPVKGVSRVRARKIREQKSKGRRRGFGSRKGKKTATLSRKSAWINKIRAQRKLLVELKDKKEISKSIYQKLYLQSKGGFFRSRRHITIYITEHNLGKK